MRAMILENWREKLQLRNIPLPIPKKGQVRLKIIACAICRTDLHLIDGELSPPPKLPIIPGHQIVGEVDTDGDRWHRGDIVAAAWLGGACGSCSYCLCQEENLCDLAQFTGYTFNGGFAQYCITTEAFLFPVPNGYLPIEAAPLLCAGMIGYRALKKSAEAKTIGLYGFGAAARLLIQVACYQEKQVIVFTRPGDTIKQELARKMGAIWAGNTDQPPPVPLDAAIIFAQDGAILPGALKATRKGGKVICAEITMSDIPSFPYSLIWGERKIESIAHLTRKDGEEFLNLASKIKIEAEVTSYPLEESNKAIDQLRKGSLSKVAVLCPNG